MSFFGRVLASIGIGSAKVDTVLEKSSYFPGEEIRGVVRIQGGSVEQQVDGIRLSVMTTYLREMNDSKIHQNAQISSIRVSQPQLIAVQELKEIPFSFVLPWNTPLTMGRTPVWIKTEVDIQSAVDPSDEDRIQISPTAHQRTVLQAIENLGFGLRDAETLYAPRMRQSLPFVQEFEWVPTGGRYRGRLDELELIFLDVRPDGADLLLQIDRKASGMMGMFAEALDADEKFVRISLTANDLNAGAHKVAGIIDSVVAKYS
ncbi:sporulation protein [Cohnella lupini]|uniref:Sporulation-control protein n=1 Tax=Cohnella lupini TaxID=1294267 RepID=A0A3D9IPV4_9BACL|nr:sporulation protein [Cohnella lupini]RED63820.1 sporulation-control protein [Cohnella lupini]